MGGLCVQNTLCLSPYPIYSSAHLPLPHLQVLGHSPYPIHVSAPPPSPFTAPFIPLPHLYPFKASSRLSPRPPPWLPLLDLGPPRPGPPGSAPVARGSMEIGRYLRWPPDQGRPPGLVCTSLVGELVWRLGKLVPFQLGGCGVEQVCRIEQAFNHSYPHR